MYVVGMAQVMCGIKIIILVWTLYVFVYTYCRRYLKTNLTIATLFVRSAGFTALVKDSRATLHMCLALREL